MKPTEFIASEPEISEIILYLAVNCLYLFEVKIKEKIILTSTFWLYSWIFYISLHPLFADTVQKKTPNTPKTIISFLFRFWFDHFIWRIKTSTHTHKILARVDYISPQLTKAFSKIFFPTGGSSKPVYSLIFVTIEMFALCMRSWEKQKRNSLQ